VNILLFNNRIYGLTKASTPHLGVRQADEVQPDGTIERPIAPGAHALAAQATFVARSSTRPQPPAKTIEAAARHRGTSFVEILQNCRVFTKGFRRCADRSADAESAFCSSTVNRSDLAWAAKALRVRDMEPWWWIWIVTGCRNRRRWCTTRRRFHRRWRAAGRVEPAEFPTALGVFRDVERPVLRIY